MLDYFVIFMSTLTLLFQLFMVMCLLGFILFAARGQRREKPSLMARHPARGLYACFRVTCYYVAMLRSHVLFHLSSMFSISSKKLGAGR